MAKTESEREETRQFRELRKEIIKTKKENAQLRKRIHQLEQMMYGLDEFEEEEPESITINNTKEKLSSPDKDSCPSCGSYDIVKFPLMNDQLYFKCLCGKKGKVQ